MIKIILVFIIFVGFLFANYNALYLLILKQSDRLHGRSLLKKIAPPKQKEDLFLKPPIVNLLNRIGMYVYIQSYDEDVLNTQLQRVGLTGYTARTYTAKGYFMLMIGGSVTVIATLLRSPILIGVGILLTAILYLSVKEEVGERMKKKRLAIGSETPKFIQHIAAGIEVDRNIEAVVRRYRKDICGPALAYDLDVLLADLQIGNNALALIKFRDRVNIPSISRLVSILINVDQGYNQADALKLLASDVNKMALENRKRELALRPGQMKRAVIPAFAIALIAVFYAFISNMLAEVSGMF